MKNIWFLVLFVALVSAALPALFLFAASLLGLEGDFNRWLEDAYGLSFHVPLPARACWLLLLVPPLLILLYFLKLKRKPLQVPSTFLWRKSIEDLHVNSLFQWLRRNVLLLLQLLVLCAVLYALLAPRFLSRGGPGKHYVLMIDNSASMSATDVAPNRLEQAKRLALQEIDASGDRDVGMVVVFNSSAEIKQSFTGNRGLLRQAVSSVEPTERPTRVEEALSLADSLANPTRSTDNAAVAPANAEPGKERSYVANEGIPTEVHLYSDGRFPDVPEFALGNLNLHFHAVGKPGPENVDNVGIVNFSVLRDEDDPTSLQIYARVLNYRPTPADVRLEVEVRVPGEAQPRLFGKGLSLPARTRTTAGGKDGDAVLDKDTPGEASVTFDLTDLDDRLEVTVHGKLAGHRDAFGLDDEAYLVVGVVRKAQVLIVTKGDRILKAFFDDEATRAVADVAYLLPAQLADPNQYANPARKGTWDLVIFDGCAPEEEANLPRGNTLFVGCPPPPWKLSELEKVPNPYVKGWSPRYPAMRFLTGLQAIGISEAFRLKDLPPRTPRLMEGDRDLVLLAAVPRESFTDLVLAFALMDGDKWNTDWPINPVAGPSFPLFLRNVLYSLGNVSDAASEESVQPGQTKVLKPGGAVEEVQVTPPGGVAVTLERGSRADFAFNGTDRVGVYTMKWGEQRRRFAVNLLDAEESLIEPRSAIKVGEERVEAAAETRGQPRELWKWGVLAALLLLLLEWYVYNKRVFV